jgi:uncharacterized protein (DUF362 family)
MSTQSRATVYISRGLPDLQFSKIYPGDTVVLKPNLVKEHNLGNTAEWESVVTSAALIEHVLIYVAKTLCGSGKIYVCDAPQTDSSFDKIAQLLDLAQLAQRTSLAYNVSVEIVDLRNEEWQSKEETIIARKRLKGDPNGSVAFNLGRDSLFYGHPGEGKYYGADYDSAVVNKHHIGAKQEYLVCRTPIKADVFINLPKLKTHKKTGLTASLKNLVGINADKNWLPHHTHGSPQSSGDEFPSESVLRRLERFSVSVARHVALRTPILGTFLARKLRRAGKVAFGTKGVVRSGNWYGNNTTWRMVLDLNRCLLYGTEAGELDHSQRKRYYSIVDGVIAMEGDGPMHGTPKMLGLYISGEDPVAVDIVCSKVMGFDWKKIPMLREAIKPNRYRITGCVPQEIQVESTSPEFRGRLEDIRFPRSMYFRPHFGWKGHIEHE